MSNGVIPIPQTRVRQRTLAGRERRGRDNRGAKSSTETRRGGAASDRRAGPTLSLPSTPQEELQEIALRVIQSQWPGVTARELQSGRKEAGLVWPRWLFAYLLFRESGLSKRVVVDLVNWKNGSTLVSAMAAVDRDCATNRIRARQLADAVSLFRQLVKR